jgi:hypothetical protein
VALDDPAACFALNSFQKRPKPQTPADFRTKGSLPVFLHIPRHILIDEYPMTAPQESPQPIRFQGAPSMTTRAALDQILENASKSQQLLGKAMRVQEGDGGLSKVTFIQNNLVALLPKWLVSRSMLESGEFSFLEGAESSLLYFVLPLLGNKAFQPLFKSIAKKDANHVGVKAATILSTFGVTLLGGEFMTHYVKNLITAKVFKKDRFSDVVNLSQGTMKSNEPSHVVKKCENRIKQCLLGCAGILGVSAILAKGSGKDKQDVISKSARFLVERLDFVRGKNGKLCLSPRQMRLYMALSIYAYLDSARDKLERVETASRLAVILPYLAFGQGLLVKGMLKNFPKYFESIVKDPTVKDPAKREIKGIHELAEKAWTDANRDATKARQLFADPLKRKAVLTGVPLAFGVFGTGIGVGLLNRFWTQYRYKEQVAEQQMAQAANRPIPASTPTTEPVLPAVSPAGFSAYSHSPPMMSPVAQYPSPFSNQLFSEPLTNQPFKQRPPTPLEGTQPPVRYPQASINSASPLARI